MRRRTRAYPQGGLSARLAARLRDERGFMLAEKLASIVFIGLLCLVVAAGLGAALSAYGGITASSNANMLLARTVQEVNDELAFSLEADASGSFVSATTRASATLGSDADGIVMTPTENPNSAAVLVAATNGLTPEFSATPSYNESTNAWTYSVVIKNGSSVMARQTMTVGRVNPPAGI